MVALWEHNIHKVLDLQKGTLTLGKWQVTYRHTDNERVTFQYGRIGPLAEDTELEEVCHTIRAMDNTYIKEICWIHPRHLPRFIRDRWLRIKVFIDQLVYRTQTYLLSLLRCPACQRVGHSINTCWSSVRCSRCSGSHPYQANDNTCTRPYYCFQCGGPHGSRSYYCPFNQEAQQTYIKLAEDRIPIPDINRQLRQPKTQTTIPSTIQCFYAAIRSTTINTHPS